MKPKLEIQDVFRRCAADYLERFKPSYDQHKALRAIMNCRSAELGAHLQICDECGYEKPSYNSCCNRSCAKCQAFAKEEWIARQCENLLNCDYFHVVFTLPSELNAVVYQNQRVVYNLLFQAASQTLLELCADEKFLGAKPAITAVLHTWGQNLHFHPHLHCVVSGGGLTEIGAWRNSGKSFFLPVKVLSAKFKGKFLAMLGQAKLKFFGNATYLEDPISFGELLFGLRQKDWVVYCKPPFGSAHHVVNYLGRYTHRIAISNNRLLNCDDGKVSFKYRDYAAANAEKVMTLSAVEFIRRFLMHVLPKGFRKIRSCGLLAPHGKKDRIVRCKRLTNTLFSFLHETFEARCARVFGKDWNLCPCCKEGRLARAGPKTVIA
jgi:hypothetical protein